MINLIIDNKNVTYEPQDVQTIHSTHYDQKKRAYKIWDGKYFVIPKHSPWIDEKILQDSGIINKIINYTQQDNRIVEVYHISDDMIVTKFYEDYYPCLIKSSVMFYDYETYLHRSDLHYNYFKDFNRAKKFYQSVLGEYRNFHRNTDCYFKDDGANNFIVNEDYSDYKILDFGCLRYDETKEVRIRQLLDGIGGVNGNDDMLIFGKQNFTQKEKIMESWGKSVSTLFQMHVMWYESEMVSETLDSIQNALSHVIGKVEIEICLNSQTYIEKPKTGRPEEMFDVFMSHPLMKRAKITYKTDDDDFYNIADWRREKYSNDGYTVWGESDCLLPYDFFFILEQLQLSGSIIDPHTLSFSSRKMWDETWNEVEFNGLDKFTYDELWDNPLHRKTRITQSELDSINDKQIEPEIVKLNNNKIDGAIFVLSDGLPDFIPDEMHFAREDTCAQIVFEKNEVPQYHIRNRLKGHNYFHPNKRTNTEATREDNIFKKYEKESINAMNSFISNGLT